MFMIYLLFLACLIGASVHAAVTNITAVVTAYCSCSKCCGTMAAGITASGVKPVEGITSAAPRWIPFRSVLVIEGVGVRIVEDRTSRKYEGRIDVYFDQHEEAIKFGIRTNQVRIIMDKRNPSTQKGGKYGEKGKH